MSQAPPADAAAVKACCATLYESDCARLLLGDSFHPGGQGLTDRIAHMTGVAAGVSVLDVACGRGASAIHLAQRFGCRATGIDLSAANIAAAAAVAERAGVAERTEFRVADAETLPFTSGIFDVVLCECALCTFPDKAVAAREFRRVLRPGGTLGLSDLWRGEALPAELETLAAWLSCVAGAWPLEAYVDCLRAAGLGPGKAELHDDALRQLIRNARVRLLGVEALAKLGKLELDLADLDRAKRMARAAQQSVTEGLLGYFLMTARRPE